MKLYESDITAFGPRLPNHQPLNYEAFLSLLCDFYYVYMFCQIWSVSSGTQVYVSRDGHIGVTKLSFLPGR